MNKLSKKTVIIIFFSILMLSGVITSVYFAIKNDASKQVTQAENKEKD